MEAPKVPEKEKKPFVEREWSEDIEGKLDDDGFFITPNGSFWDQDYVYFNREGFDKHGGRYDENGEYIPGEGWDDNLNCYESEKEDYNNEKDDDNDLDEGYTEDAMMKELIQFNDDDDLFEGKDLIKVNIYNYLFPIFFEERFLRKSTGIFFKKSFSLKFNFFPFSFNISLILVILLEIFSDNLAIELNISSFFLFSKLELSLEVNSLK